MASRSSPCWRRDALWQAFQRKPRKPRRCKAASKTKKSENSATRRIVEPTIRFKIHHEVEMTSSSQARQKAYGDHVVHDNRVVAPYGPGRSGAMALERHLLKMMAGSSRRRRDRRTRRIGLNGLHSQCKWSNSPGGLGKQAHAPSASIGLMGLAGLSTTLKTQRRKWMSCLVVRSHV